MAANENAFVSPLEDKPGSEFAAGTVVETPSQMSNFSGEDGLPSPAVASAVFPTIKDAQT
jgi:hypothetical protein